jgi:hypothetical protein
MDLTRTSTFYFKILPLSLLALLLIINQASAQLQVNKQGLPADTGAKKPDDSYVNKRSFGHAAIQWGLTEVVVQSFDQYVSKKDYAQISLKTIGHNLNPGSWQFDNDPFQTNQIGHPYHGNLFFNSFRANGYNFWQSSAAAFAGSYVWETYAENQPPAPNDFINTGFGGTILGEMTYRISNRIINNEATGFGRQVNEIFGLLIDPQNGLARILDGKWGKYSHNNGLRDSTKIYAEFDAGLRSFKVGDALHRGIYGHIKLVYGDPYENYSTPFSNFVVNTEFGQDDSTKVNVVSVYGSLAGWEIKSDEKVVHLAILSANYDYIHNVAFFYGGQSIKINLISEFDISDKVKINTSLGTGPTLLGAVPDKYITPNGRNYDYTIGWGANAAGTVAVMNKFFLNLNYRGGWLKTINGNDSHYYLHTLSGELSYMFIKNLSICAEPGYFELQGYYYKRPDVSSRYPYSRGSLRYSVNFQ